MKTTLLFVALLAAPAVLLADSVTVRHAEGLVHGFLVLRDGAGARLADGDLIQTSSGGRVTSRLLFRFQDGSTHDETAVFTQRRTFQLISYRLIQKGRAFPRDLTVAIDHAAARSRVAVRYVDEDGEPEAVDEPIDLPADLANGMLPTLLKNVRPSDLPLTVSLLAATPKPRLVKLKISSAGIERFATGRIARQVTRYVVKVELGGLTGLIAPVFGKQPPDSYVWILGGDAPAFIQSEAPFFAGGPSWRIQLSSPEY